MPGRAFGGFLFGYNLGLADFLESCGGGSLTGNLRYHCLQGCTSATRKRELRRRVLFGGLRCLCEELLIGVVRKHSFYATLPISR